MEMHIIVLAGSFLTVTCLAAALQQLLFSRKVVAGRLAEFSDWDEIPQRRKSRESSLKDDVYLFAGSIGRVISGRSYLARVQEKLVKARIPIRAEELVGFSFIFGLGLFALTWLLAKSIPLAVIIGITGFMAPVMLVERRRQKRGYRLIQQLPDALDIVASGLRAGFSFPQSLNVVIQEMDPPISEEFARMNRKNQLGKPMADVLKELSTNSDSDDIDMVVTAILIQRQVGGNLAEILDNVAHTVRERVRIKGEIRTLTAQGRITAVVISLLPPGVMAMIAVVNPGYIRILFTETAGMIMLATAVFLQILGIIALRRIINIEI